MTNAAFVSAENSTNVRVFEAERPQPRAGLLQRASAAVARLFPSVAVRAVERGLVTPRRFPVPAREEKWLEGAVLGSLDVDGRRLGLTSWGHGPVVLLVHGWEGRGSQWGALATRLAELGFRAVALDVPAHGHSPGRTTNLREIAAAVGAAVDHLQPVAVVAHSAGSVGTTLALAGRRVPRLVLVAPVVDVEVQIRWIATRTGLPLGVIEKAWDRVGRRVGLRREDLRPESLGRPLATELLVVHDLDDPEASIDDARRLVANVPGASLTLTRGLGHRRILRDTAAVGAILGFLREAQAA